MHGIAPPAKNDPAPHISSVEAEEPCSRPRSPLPSAPWVFEVQTKEVTFKSSRGFQATPSAYVALIFRMSCLFRKRTESPGRSQLPRLRSSTQCQRAPPFRQASIIEVVYGECGGGVLMGLGPFPSSETLPNCSSWRAQPLGRLLPHYLRDTVTTLPVTCSTPRVTWLLRVPTKRGCWAVPQHTYIGELSCWASPLLPSSPLW